MYALAFNIRDFACKNIECVSFERFSALIEDVLQQHRPSSVELSQLLYCNRHLSATDEELDNIFKRYGHLISV